MAAGQPAWEGSRADLPRRAVRPGGGAVSAEVRRRVSSESRSARGAEVSPQEVPGSDGRGRRVPGPVSDVGRGDARRRGGGRQRDTRADRAVGRDTGHRDGTARTAGDGQCRRVGVRHRRRRRARRGGRRREQERGDVAPAVQRPVSIQRVAVSLYRAGGRGRRGRRPARGAAAGRGRSGRRPPRCGSDHRRDFRRDAGRRTRRVTRRWFRPSADSASRGWWPWATAALRRHIAAIRRRAASPSPTSSPVASGHGGGAGPRRWRTPRTGRPPAASAGGTRRCRRACCTRAHSRQPSR